MTKIENLRERTFTPLSTEKRVTSGLTTPELTNDIINSNTLIPYTKKFTSDTLDAINMESDIIDQEKNSDKLSAKSLLLDPEVSKTWFVDDTEFESFIKAYNFASRNSTDSQRILLTAEMTFGDNITQITDSIDSDIWGEYIKVYNDYKDTYIPTKKEVEDRINELKEEGYVCLHCNTVSCGMMTGSTVCEPDAYSTSYTPMSAAILKEEWGYEVPKNKISSDNK